jgi:hypothetical protein
MGNSDVSETALLREVLDGLTKRLPSGWTAAKEPGKGSSGRRPDAVLVIEGPDRKSARVVVEVKKTLEPRNVPTLAAQLKGYQADAILVIAPFLGSRARQLLRERQCGYADSTGNLWLSLSRPGLFVETSGATKDPTPLGRPLRSLKGPATGRALRALCDFKEPLRVRELAQRARLPAPTLSRVIDFLAREALIEKDQRGVVVRVDWKGVIRRWAEDYSFTKSNRVSTFLEARGPGAVREKLPKVSWRYAVTGSVPASMIAPVAAPRLIQVYVDEANIAAEALDLRSAESGANVMLVEPFNEVVFDRTMEREGIVCAALSQVAVDLLTSPGRGPQEADKLLEWMAENVDGWRT